MEKENRAYVYVNCIKTKSGALRAVCEICGGKSRAVDLQGKRLSMWDLGRGWTEAPFPPNFVHSDGSSGSLFQCPSCNKKFKKLKPGEGIKSRDYQSGAAVPANK